MICRTLLLEPTRASIRETSPIILTTRAGMTISQNASTPTSVKPQTHVSDTSSPNAAAITETPRLAHTLPVMPRGGPAAIE